MVDGRGAGHGADVEEDADVGLEDGSEGVEEPAVGVYLFLVFFFEAEDDLDGDDAFFGAFDFVGGGYGDYMLSMSTGRISAKGRKDPLCVVYSYICAVTGFPLTIFFAIPS